MKTHIPVFIFDRIFLPERVHFFYFVLFYLFYFLFFCGGGVGWGGGAASPAPYLPQLVRLLLGVLYFSQILYIVGLRGKSGCLIRFTN